MEEDNRHARAKSFAKIWMHSRSNAKKSQEYMALSLGVSKKTVQNWENGISSPSAFMAFEWFRVLGENLLPYFLEYMYPDYSGAANSRAQMTLSEECVDKTIRVLLEQMTLTERKQLLFLMIGEHGSPWHALLQLFTAYCHTSMQSRVATATGVLESYEMEMQNGRLQCPDSIAPNVQVLRESLLLGKHAASYGEKGYSVWMPLQNDSNVQNTIDAASQ